MIEEQYLNSEKVNEVRQRNRTQRLSTASPTENFWKWLMRQVRSTVWTEQFLSTGTFLMSIWSSFIKSPAPIPLTPRENRPGRTERSRNDGKYLDVFALAGC